MKETVSDLYSKIKGEAAGLERLLEKIPGISGYMEKGKRRQADEMLRQALANRLEDVRLNFSTVHQDISHDIIKAIDHAEPLGRVDTLFNSLIGKIKDAPTGYAGFFDAVKVKEDDLARIYAFDESMVGHVDQVEASTAALGKAAREDGDIGERIRELTAVLRDAIETFSQRDNVIKGIAEGDSGTYTSTTFTTDTDNLKSDTN